MHGVDLIRVYRIPFSTNVERVALAAGHKGVAVEWVDVDPVDRSPVRAVSGQDLVPVVEADGQVLFDSPLILAWLEERHPEPPLYPADEARRAEVQTFLDWFNLLWKRPPNCWPPSWIGRSRTRRGSRSSADGSPRRSTGSRCCSPAASTCSASSGSPT